jgi:hypothetical protein
MPGLANIGPRGIRARAIQGALALAAALALPVIQTVRGSPPVWTLGCAPLFWLAGLGILQARAKT